MLVQLRFVHLPWEGRCKSSFRFVHQNAEADQVDFSTTLTLKSRLSRLGLVLGAVGGMAGAASLVLANLRFVHLASLFCWGV